jgi:tRNA (guanine37-N1)-methyltransferase
MRIDIVSLFPEMFDGPLGHSIIKRAIDAGLLSVGVTNPRDFAFDKHRIVDDYPFGGGSGMVMKPEPLFLAVESLTAEDSVRRRVVLLCPGGSRFDQAKARELAGCDHLVLVCGHYEGVDERVKEHLADEVTVLPTSWSCLIITPASYSELYSSPALTSSKSSVLSFDTSSNVLPTSSGT